MESMITIPHPAGVETHAASAAQSYLQDRPAPHPLLHIWDGMFRMIGNDTKNEV